MTCECHASCRHDGAASQSLEETFFTSRKSIHKAVIDGDLGRVTALLDSRPERVEECDEAGYVPILYAKSIEMVRLLVGKGADLRAGTREGHRRLLHRAVLRNDGAMVQALLDMGVRDTEDADGRLARQLAIEAGHTNLAHMISRQDEVAG